MATSFLHFTSNSSFSSLSRSKPHKFSPSHKSMRINVAFNNTYWTSISADVEAHLEQIIPVYPQLSMLKPMHHLVFEPTKNMAPALCVAACELVGGNKEQAIYAALTLHLATYVTDEQIKFLNQTKPNSKFMVHHRVLPIGFELLARSNSLIELLARSNSLTSVNSNQILRVIIEIAQITGSRCIISQQSRIRSLDDQVCENMEGGLYACGAKCGAILGGGSEDETEKLRRFGFYVELIHKMMVNEDGRGDEMVRRLKSLALKELEGFKQGNVDKISSLVDEFEGFKQVDVDLVDPSCFTCLV